jgi:OHCU decarboxylase
VAHARPYRDVDALLDAADAAWWKLDEADWLEAFAAHPRIGERGGHQPESSDREQSRVMAAETGTREAIAEESRKYEARFGHVFLISAAGKSAGEVLAALRERMDNTPDAELRVAAGEQAKITRSRLGRMLSG